MTFFISVNTYKIVNMLLIHYLCALEFAYVLLNYHIFSFLLNKRMIYAVLPCKLLATKPFFFRKVFQVFNKGCDLSCF